MKRAAATLVAAARLHAPRRLHPDLSTGVKMARCVLERCEGNEVDNNRGQESLLPWFASVMLAIAIGVGLFFTVGPRGEVLLWALPGLLLLAGVLALFRGRSRR